MRGATVCRALSEIAERARESRPIDSRDSSLFMKSVTRKRLWSGGGDGHRNGLMSRPLAWCRPIFRMADPIDWQRQLRTASGQQSRLLKDLRSVEKPVQATFNTVSMTLL